MVALAISSITKNDVIEMPIFRCRPRVDTRRTSLGECPVKPTLCRTVSDANHRLRQTAETKWKKSKDRFECVRQRQPTAINRQMVQFSWLLIEKMTNVYIFGNIVIDDSL